MRFAAAKPEIQRVGILAGWGRFPIIVAQALKQQGYYVSCQAIIGHADPVLKEICDDFRWLGIAKLGSAIRYFQRHKIDNATMAGKFHKVVLYQPWLILRHLPDWKCIKTFYPHFASTKKDRKDDTLLSAIVGAFAEDGICFRPATDYAPELLVKTGQLSGRKLTAAQLSDVEFGWQLAKEMGRLDVGQSICVKDRAVLAVEAIEGTDQCILRAGELCKKGKFSVIKVAKPQQDMRFDVPTVGIQTLQTMVTAGANVLAVEAARTILLDEQEFIDYAQAHQITVVALDRQAATAAA